MLLRTRPLSAGPPPRRCHRLLSGARLSGRLLLRRLLLSAYSVAVRGC